MRTLRALTAAGAAALLAAAGTTAATGTTAAAGTTAATGTTALIGTTAAAPGPPTPKPQITDAQVDTALRRLDATVTDMMRRTGVPGVSVAVVHDDKVVHLKGFGLRRVGDKAAVDPDTVFQIASLSKPVSSTVVAGVLKDPADWDRHTELPGFALKDPWVTSHVTTADLFSHRSGLPDHAGDLLEDLGYDQAYVLDHLRLAPSPPSGRATPTPTSVSPPPPRPSPVPGTPPGRSSAPTPSSRRPA